MALKHPTLYCRPCEAFTSDNDAMIELGGEIPSGGFTEIEKEIKIILGATTD